MKGNKGRQEIGIVSINRTRAIKEFVTVERPFRDGEVFERNRIGLAEADEDHVAASMAREVDTYAVPRGFDHRRDERAIFGNVVVVSHKL